jgi:DNA-binding NarL/FixJ family response regulator
LPLQIRVLIVDDEPDVRMALRAIVEFAGMGLEVCGEAPDGPAAIELLETADPHVVILDYRMPQLDGIETAALMRRRRPDQPIILYTAQLDTRLEAAAAAVGINACMPKIDLENLPELAAALAGTGPTDR